MAYSRSSSIHYSSLDDPSRGKDTLRTMLLPMQQHRKKSINSKNTRLASEIYLKVLIQPAITCLMLTIKTMKQGMKYVQS